MTPSQAAAITALIDAQTKCIEHMGARIVELERMMLSESRILRDVQGEVREMTVKIAEQNAMLGEMELEATPYRRVVNLGPPDDCIRCQMLMPEAFCALHTNPDDVRRIVLEEKIAEVAKANATLTRDLSLSDADLESLSQ